MPQAGARREDPLATYTSKRRFEDTPEPKGKVRTKSGSRYSIQKHAATRLHYDLRLELDGVLKSWAITRGPSANPSEKRLSVRTEDHPVDYADFEGRIPEGNYGAGTVLLWDRGTWEPVGDPHKGLEDGKLVFDLKGERLRGRWALVRFRGKDNERRENWLLIKEDDDEADRKKDITKTYQTSVTSGHGMEEIAKAPDAVWSGGGQSGTGSSGPKSRKPKTAKLPAFVKPALATLVDDTPKGENWLFEIKFDGYRALAAVSGTKVRIFTRNQLDWTDKFAPIANALGRLDLSGALLDGEIVALDENGISDFSRLQQAIKSNKGDLVYFAFDLLSENGKSLRNRPLIERKDRLRKLLGKAGRTGPVYFTDHLEGNGAAMLNELCGKGYEGIIAKRADLPYRSGRGRAWLKIKCNRDQEFVIIGWSPSKKRPFASLLLGVHEKGKLHYAGRVGTGFSDQQMIELREKLDRLARKTPPVENGVPREIARDARWVRPELVSQVGFAEFTREGYVRQARFLGLREDKPARMVGRDRPSPVKETREMAGADEKATIANVQLSHPDRVLFPEQGITKRDLAVYLEKMAGPILAHAADRLLSLVRCPQGREEKCFFQRHGGAGLKEGFRALPVKQKDGTREDYLYLKNKQSLVTAAQMGVLEFHIWGSRIDDIERPDRLVFDLDPDENLGFAEVKTAAFHMRDVLDALGLQSFPLLTGGKGIHVVAPLVRHHEWPVIKEFAATVAKRLAAEDPDSYVAVASKAKRKGRIFIDYLRNERGSTAIAPYSPRARAGAPVAWPVDWEKLEEVDRPDRYRLGDVEPGMAVAWAEYPNTRQSLKKASLEALGLSAD